MRPLIYRGLNRLCTAAYSRSAMQFDAALENPESVQRDLLLQMLRWNRNCIYGKRHAFNSIRTVRDYQQRVPIVSYDDLADSSERMKAGEQAVLMSEPVLMFEKSSGSASAAKYIPYTHTLMAQFQAALGPWITDLYRSFPPLAEGCAYWLVTPLAGEREITAGGIPVGFENDAEYFGFLGRWLLGKIMAVPSELARVASLEDCLYLTLRFLLQARSLTFVSVWNPSFLLILLDRLQMYGDRLAQDLLDGKARVSVPLPAKIRSGLGRDENQSRNLQAMLSRGRVEPGVLWPRLALISCWTSAESSATATEIQRAFPGVRIQGKGLLATEGLVSIPIERFGGCVAAVASHFLEFLELKSGTCRLLSELVEGEEYSVILTTGGGLWRYQLGDRVRVTGFAGRTPILEFVGKEDCVCDLRGEKLNAVFVSKVLAEFKCCRSATFAMLAPSADRKSYTLFLEGSCEGGLEKRIEQRLRTNPHYTYCRNLGQLGDLQLFRIQHGARESYLKHCQVLGQRPGSVKMTALHKHSGWEKVFAGSYVRAEPAEVCA